MSITAKFERDLSGFTGSAKLWSLSEEVPYGFQKDDSVECNKTKYVATSATDVMLSGAETFIFPTDENGSVLDWSEMEGSFRGSLNHEQAILNAGWEISL